MKKTLTLFAVAILFATQTTHAQQQAQFTQYMFVPLVFNPAYAGARDHMAINVLHRTQWVSVEGAPATQAFTIHSPLQSERIGLGFGLVNDKIGPMNTLNLNASYAYRIPMGDAKLSIGLQGGFTNWRADWSKLTKVDINDPAYQGNLNLWKPNFGVGLYYYSKSFFIGAACPQLIEWSLRENPQESIWARQYRHFYGSVGGAINLSGEDLVFRPMILVKNSGWLSRFNKDVAFKNTAAPTSVDLDLSLFFYQTLWIGAAYRAALEQFNNSTSHDSFDVWASYYMTNGLRIGFAYDLPLTKLRSATAGSFEVMLGYEFDYKTKRVVTPRYF